MRGESERWTTMLLGLTSDALFLNHSSLKRILRRTLCGIEDEPFHPTTFTKSRERLL